MYHAHFIYETDNETDNISTHHGVWFGNASGIPP